ncbi:hypothetical protein ACFPZI_35515 [Streptomyces chlorus]|uniref:Integral membrane protein n=1 Tax=Streptomyces chlorus TaxID=887452 RepID=A0ABW1E7M0_9ACTN
MRAARPGGTALKALITAVLAGVFATQATAALLPNAPLLIAATVAALAVEGILYRWQPGMLSLFAKAHADITVRHVLRDLLLVVGLLRLAEQGREAQYTPLVAGLLLFYALHCAIQAVSILVRRTRTLPVLTRNIDASALRLSPAPAALLRRPGYRLLVLGLPTTVGLAATAMSREPLPAAAGIALSLVLAAAGLGALLMRLLPSRRPAGEQEVLDWFDAWLADYRPTVGLYFSGGVSSAYQANMWLETMSRLGERPVVILRERFMVARIAPTDIPVVCLPKVSTLMRLEHSTLQVLIHPSNSGKTSQVLRIPTIKHAFVNHGESDKLSSCNPYAKAYDEVWVAGPEARERYARAEVGIEDKDVVEIGRPQLGAVHPRSGPPAADARTTVLYAPTWEGWDGNPGNTSVIAAGENLVQALLADPDVRLLYKPHPLTGSVVPAAGAADLRIRDLIRAANQERSRSHSAPSPSSPSPSPAERARAASELDRLTAELDRLTATGSRADADQMERMLAQGAPPPGRAEAVAQATAAWEEAYWASLPQAEHQIVTDVRPALYACFNVADLLISDVSSVISDFLASGKPYAVANTSGLPEEAFRAAFPTVAAATVLTPDASGVPALLEAVRHPEKDELVEARGVLKLRLLGPDEPTSQQRCNMALRDLSTAALNHGARMAQTQMQPETQPQEQPQRERQVQPRRLAEDLLPGPRRESDAGAGAGVEVGADAGAPVTPPSRSVPPV